MNPAVARARPLIDLYFRWVRTQDAGALQVLADALEERGYPVADRVARMLKKPSSRGLQRIVHKILQQDIASYLLRETRSPDDSQWVDVGMVEGFEEAVWLPQWAQAMEEARRSLPRNITRESAPGVPLSALELARRFALALICENDASLTELWQRASDAEGADVNPTELGWYLGMEAQGHGVAWTDNHAPFPIRVARAEWWAIPRGQGWQVEGYP